MRGGREDAEPGIARVAVDVDKDIDAIFRDHGGRIVITDAANVAPLVAIGLDAGLDRIIRLDAGVVSEHLEVLAIVLLEEVDHQIADGVMAQVRGDIADAQAAAGFDGRAAAIEARGAILDRRHCANVPVGCGKLEQRVVRVGADRERVQTRDQIAARELAVGRRHRPLALGEARGDVLFCDVTGVGNEFEALREGDLGGCERLIVRQDAGDLLQQRDLVVDAVRRNRSHLVKACAPFVDGLLLRTAAL